MKYIEALHENMHVSDIYLCRSRQMLLTKNGKEYGSLVLQDKTGTVDAKIWDPGNPGIEEFSALDYVYVDADVTSFNNALQLNIRRIRKAGEDEYNPEDYLPVSSKNIDGMYAELLGEIKSVKEEHLNKLLCSFFVEDAKFIKEFRFSSAAKNIHHGYVGGLLEHTLSVTKLCEYYCSTYPGLNHDLLITAAICHDIGKTRELSPFPANDYTDEGQLLGHIVMGCEMIGERIKNIPGFPEKKATELKHCILSHHGEYEFGSPKKPALIEAMALNFADNTDAKMEIFRELLDAAGTNDGWLGFNRLMESNVRKTSE